MKRATLSLLICISSWLCGCASEPNANTKHKAAIEHRVDKITPAPLRERLLQVDQALRQGNCSMAMESMSPIAERTTFETLNFEDQFYTLNVATLCVGRDARYESTHSLLRQLAPPAQGSPAEWRWRQSTVTMVGRPDDAAATLTTVAQNWPSALKHIDDRIVYDVLSATRDAPNKHSARLQLLNALFDAKWKQQEDEREPSNLWRDYAILSIERNEVSRAREAVLRITHPYVLIGVRADRRFDAIVAENPVHFDVHAALEDQIGHLKSVLQRKPDSGSVANSLANMLFHAGRYREALDMLDRARSRIRRTSGTEGGENLNWVLNARSIALRNLGRADESLKELERAQQVDENGNSNVSQTINLAGAYCNAGRPDDALRMVQKAERVSNYGGMQVARVRLCAAVQQNDTKATQNALAYLKEHQRDSIATYEWALLVDGKIEEAAQLLVYRLLDPQLRNEALVSLQEFDDPPIEPMSFSKKIIANRREMIRQPAVVEAIAKVGRIDHYNIQVP